MHLFYIIVHLPLDFSQLLLYNEGEISKLIKSPEVFSCKEGVYYVQKRNCRHDPVFQAKAHLHAGTAG